MDVGRISLIALSVLVAVWYLAGTIINRKRGLATYYWLREGLREAVGEPSEGQWLNPAGTQARLAVANARAPFRKMEITFSLIARDILPLWLFNLVRGKGDEMIVTASLRSLPASREATPAWDNFLKRYPAVVDLTISQRRPHIRMRVALPALQRENTPASEFFAALAEASQKAIAVTNPRTH